VKIKGISCENTRRIVEATLDTPGWIYRGVTKSGHGRMTWEPTNSDVFFGLTPSDQNSWKVLAREIEKVSGLRLVVQTKRKAGYRPPAVQQDSKRVVADRKRFEDASIRKAGERLREMEAEAERRRSIEKEIDDDNRRRFYGPLMQPGRYPPESAYRPA